MTLMKASPKGFNATPVSGKRRPTTMPSTVITTVHPRIAFLDLVDRAELPPDFVGDIEAWQSRSGTVKVNYAVDRLPTFTAHPSYDPQVYGGTIVLAESLDEIETAYQEAVSGRPATEPFADICIPSVFDPTLAPEGHHEACGHVPGLSAHPNRLCSFQTQCASAALALSSAARQLW